MRGRKGQYRNSRLKGWFALPILLPGVQLLTGSIPVPCIFIIVNVSFNLYVVENVLKRRVIQKKHFLLYIL